MNDLKSGVAVVTGAGSGLGRALSLQLCNEGLVVAGLGRRADALEHTRQAANGELFHAYPVDVSIAADVRGIIETIVQAHGPITILVNNAAINPHRDFLDESGESFANTVAINLGGTVNVTRAVLDNMVQSGVGRILNVSSFAGDAPAPANSAYSVSKGAQRIFSQALSRDLSDRFPDIVVNTWMPGALATDMGPPTGIAPEHAAIWGVKLAFSHDRSLTGTTFERDTELLPNRSLKRRILDTVLMRHRRPRRV